MAETTEWTYGKADWLVYRHPYRVNTDWRDVQGDNFESIYQLHVHNVRLDINWNDPLVTVLRAWPWRGGHEVSFCVQGDYLVTDEHRLSLANGGYGLTVNGDRITYVRKRAEISNHVMNTTMGEGELVVCNGNYRSYSAYGMTKMMVGASFGEFSGQHERVWNGPITRVAMTDGIIAGGLGVRIYLTGCTQVSLLSMLDIFTAGVMSSVTRVAAGPNLIYRSSEKARQAKGIHVVNCSLLVEPDIATGTFARRPGGLKKQWAGIKSKKNVFAKVWAFYQFLGAAIGVIGQYGSWFFAPIGIVLGLVVLVLFTLLPGPIMLSQFIYGKLHKPRPGDAPDKGPPGPLKTRMMSAQVTINGSRARVIN